MTHHIHLDTVHTNSVYELLVYNWYGTDTCTHSYFNKFTALERAINIVQNLGDYRWKVVACRNGETVKEWDGVPRHTKRQHIDAVNAMLSHFGHE